MIFESKKLSKTVETVQKFILDDCFPIPINTTCMISAKGGVGKTNLSLFIASKYINRHDGNVALWLTEDEEGNIRHRVNKLLEHNIIDEFNEHRTELIINNPLHLVKTINKEFVADEDVFNSLKLFCIEKDIRLLVIDPLLAFYGGNENDNSQARVFMQPFINWCKELDITIILIHHSSKGENNTRGAGAFIDAVRSAYTISMPLCEEGKMIVEDKEKIAQGFRVITCTKDNRGVIPLIYKHYNNNPFEMRLIPPIDILHIPKSNINFDSIIQNAKARALIAFEETIFKSDDNSFMEGLL